MSVAATLAPAAPSGAQAPIRVMIVDDAVVVRGLVSRWIEEEPGLEVVASLRTGRDAVAQVERTRPDVILLDVEMPELDGISALPLLLEKKRDLVIIMVSTVTRRNAEISLRALALGAADYVPKPETNRGITTSVEFRRELIEKTRLLGGRRKGLVPQPAARAPLAPVRPAGVASERPGIAAIPAGPSIRLRPFSLVMPRVLAIGASTGGPQALNTVVSRIGPVVDRVPVLITQHMPPTFTTILAEHLTRAAERTAREASDGEPIRPGCIYVAPGGRHMRVAAHAAGPVIALDDGPLVNFCRPAVDPLFASVAGVYGGAALALILTGMGSDGADGARDIARHGGSVIAQDEATSVVWGMPGSAAHAGVCSAVLPLDQIAPKLLRMFAGDRT